MKVAAILGAPSALGPWRAVLLGGGAASGACFALSFLAAVTTRKHGIQASGCIVFGVLLPGYVNFVLIWLRGLTACVGVLFICLNVDYRVLFTPLTEEVAKDGIEFYTTFYRSPPAIKVRATCSRFCNVAYR